MKRYPDPQSHPLEHEVVRLVDRYLTLADWDLARLKCLVEFGVRVRTASDHSLSVQSVDGNGRSVGQVRLWYNFAYLHQRPGPFLQDIVAHEVAHVVMAGETLRTGRPTPPLHGDEWASWLARFSRHARPEASGPGPLFDDLAIRLNKGGRPARCECPGAGAFQVMSAPGRARTERCDECGAALQAVSVEDIPAPIADEQRFIHGYHSPTVISGWLD